MHDWWAFRLLTVEDIRTQFNFHVISFISGKTMKMSGYTVRLQWQAWLLSTCPTWWVLAFSCSSKSFWLACHFTPVILKCISNNDEKCIFPISEWFPSRKIYCFLFAKYFWFICIFWWFDILQVFFSLSFLFNFEASFV